MYVPVYVSESWERSPICARPYRCPTCGWAGDAMVTLRWRVRRAWGIPMKVGMVGAEWWCSSCGAATLGVNPTGAQPPATQRYGAAIFLSVTLSIVFAVAYASLARSSPSSSPLAALGKMGEARDERARVHARAARAQGEVAVERCRTTVRDALAKAVPGRYLDLAPMKPSQPIDVRKIATAPADPNGLDSWWTACKLEVDSDDRARIEYGSTSGDSPGTIDAAADRYAAAAAALKPPDLVRFIDSDVQGKRGVFVDALITLDGRLLGVAAAKGKVDPALEKQQAQLDSWQQQPRTN